VSIPDAAYLLAANAAFFTADGDHYLPGPLTRGPWGNTLSGTAVGGLLGWALERQAEDLGLQPARLTVDLLRPVLPESLQVQTSVQREGRRIKLVDSALLQRGAVVARASALFLRRGEQPGGQVWSPPVSMPPLPTSLAGQPPEMPFFLWTYGTNRDTGGPGISPAEWEQDHAQKFAWVQLVRELVAGYPMTPLTRIAFVGDVTSSLTHWGTGGLRYINADYTLALSRLPAGEFIGLAAQSHYGNAGVATGTATLFDHRGPLGTSTVLTLAQPAEAFNPPQPGVPGAHR
jgi:hypothetical protein